MTRRLLTIDLTLAEGRMMAQAMRSQMLATREKQGMRRDHKTTSRALKKLYDAWDARGHEGRGIDTRLKTEI